MIDNEHPLDKYYNEIDEAEGKIPKLLTFEEEYKIPNCQLKMSAVNDAGVYFQILPLVSTDMPAEQIKAELKVAVVKLHNEIKNWEREHLSKREVREAILHITSPQSSERIELLKELGL